MRQSGRPALTDVGSVAVASAACLGALAARSVPWALGAVAVSVALGLRRPVLLTLAVFLLASSLGARSWAGLTPADVSAYRGPATLLTDPEPTGVTRPAGGVARSVRSVRATVRVGTERLDLWAAGSAARRLAVRRAGEVVWVDGRIRPPSPARARWLATRHVVGSISVERVIDWSPGSALSRSANRVRELLERGARVLTPDDRALYLGLVIGDDRAQPPDMVDTFRRAGLGHLNAVSGQNVAFVLAVVSPALRRCRPLPRWVLTMAFLGWFAVLTRLEPSVLRATVMAALAATAFALGREASSLRLVALTVAVLVLVDPLLVHSVGFWMSVAATSGIVLWSGPVAVLLSPLRRLAVPVAVSISAQVGVAPVGWWVFGRESTLSLPANVLAGPCAAVVMTLGIPAGLLASVVPDQIAAVVHGPTFLALASLRAIAGIAAAADTAVLRPIATVTGIAVVARALHRQHRSPPIPVGAPGPDAGAGRFAP